MSTEYDVDGDLDEELGNGDTVAERVENINLDSEETCSTDEMREMLGL